MSNTRISAETHAAITAAWDSLLTDVAAGNPIGASIKARGFSPDMVRSYREANPTAAAQWESARLQSADAFADDILATIYNAALDPQHARVRVDSLKWLAAKRNPRIYSDRSQLDVNVRHVDLTAIISAANARLTAARAALLERDVTHAGTHVMVPAALRTLL